MVIKIISLFLISMLVLAMFGKLRLPKSGKGPTRMVGAKKCPKCGSYRIGTGPCACEKRG